MPITEGDVPYVRAKQKELNAMLAAQSAANGALQASWPMLAVYQSTISWVG